MARLIGVMDSDGGAFREFLKAMGLRASGCPLTKLAGSALRPKSEWRAMTERLHAQTGHSFDLVYRNTRSDKERAASSGREPCILLEADDSSLSMVADWNDLQLAAGDVASFERILLAKLLMY